MSKLFKKIGLRIHKRRREFRLTQEKLGELVNISPSYVGAIERGTREPTLTLLSKISRALDITLGELLYEESKDHRKFSRKQACINEVQKMLSRLSTEDVHMALELVKLLYKRRIKAKK